MIIESKCSNESIFVFSRVCEVHSVAQNRTLEDPNNLYRSKRLATRSQGSNGGGTYHVPLRATVLLLLQVYTVVDGSIGKVPR
jgi:hypothetical protein